MADELSTLAPVRVLQLYFRVRPPWKLAADGVLCFMAWGVFSHLWVAFGDAATFEDRTRPAANLLAALTRPATVMQSISTTVFYIATALFAWACVRLVAESLRPRDPG
ncbi:MAG TPA: hypothetical protein PLU35_08215 [Phycisphaerales bacterium]|nr:hypothetical protein [Phycisphaerales bacterium]